MNGLRKEGEYGIDHIQEMGRFKQGGHGRARSGGSRLGMAR